MGTDRKPKPGFMFRKKGKKNEVEQEENEDDKFHAYDPSAKDKKPNKDLEGQDEEGQEDNEDEGEEEQSSGPKLGKKFKTKTIVVPHDGEEGEASPIGKFHETAKGNIKGKPHEAVINFYGTINQVISLVHTEGKAKLIVNGLVAKYSGGNNVK